MKEKKKDGEGGGRPRGSRKNIIGRYVMIPEFLIAFVCEFLFHLCQRVLLLYGAVERFQAVGVPRNSAYAHLLHC